MGRVKVPQIVLWKFEGGNLQMKNEVTEFEDLAEDIVVLNLQAGLPKGYSIKTASLVTYFKVQKNRPRKLLFVTYQHDETGKTNVQSYNYLKVLRHIDRGLQLAAVKE
jgi:hypothetical protein